LRGRWLDSPPDDIAICSVVKEELLYGAAMSDDPVGARARLAIVFERLQSLPFDDRAAELCGDLRGRLGRRGEMIGTLDAMIAAIALSNDVTLVTRNLREVKRVPGLRVAKW
jgi:tRNA(fMet)-specific endonuclease VapC